MTLGKKVLIGVGGFIGLITVIGLAAPPTKPADQHAVLGAQASTAPVSTVTSTPSTKSTITPSSTPTATPKVAATVAPTPTVQTTPANTYTNVDGNKIESPDGNTSGATGVCNDGTYTHAVHHQGACSSHGGVNYWF